MAGRRALQFDLAGPESLHETMRRLTDLGTPRKTLENAVMRDLSYQAATRLAPIYAAGIARSPAPQAAAVAATVRPKRDRMIVLVAGAVNPKLSGWKRSSKGKSWRGSVAWGVAVGPLPHTQQVTSHTSRTSRRRGSTRYQVPAHTRRYGNPYTVGRRGGPPDPTSGYLAATGRQLTEQAEQAYADIILTICARNGWDIQR